MDTNEIMRAWNHSSALMRKPKLEEACDVIAHLCMELTRAREEVKHQKNRQYLKDETYETMMEELHNVLSNYA